VVGTSSHEYLARLLRDTNRQDGARRNLQLVHRGFDAADVKDAKSLVNEMGG